MNKDVITLLDEEGKEIEFTLFSMVTVGPNHYALLLPVKTESETQEDIVVEAVIMRIEGENLVLVENDEELNRVLQYVEENGILDELLQ